MSQTLMILHAFKLNLQTPSIKKITQKFHPTEVSSLILKALINFPECHKHHLYINLFFKRDVKYSSALVPILLDSEDEDQ